MSRLLGMSRAGRLVVAVAVAGVTFGIATAVQASIPDANGVIHACYNTSPAHGTPTGGLRVVDPALSAHPCASWEAPLNWIQRGVTGPKGATGAKGTTGKTGPTGAPGPVGLTFDQEVFGSATASFLGTADAITTYCPVGDYIFNGGWSYGDTIGGGDYGDIQSAGINGNSNGQQAYEVRLLDASGSFLDETIDVSAQCWKPGS